MSLRHRLYAGEILIIPRSRASDRLCRITEEILCREFGTPDLSKHFTPMSPAALQAALDRGRSLVYSNESVVAAAWELIASLGQEPCEYRMDPPRLRIVLPATNAATWQQSNLHRDVWYAEPGNQINLWLPLCNTAVQALGIWPHYFKNPIKNSSQLLDRQQWEQDAASGRIEYPEALQCPVGRYKSFDLERSEVLAFSANHLHCTLANRMPLPRISIDFRTVHVSDYFLGLGPAMPDNRSRGTTFARMLEYSTNTGSSEPLRK